jgi:hypothetical protein
VETGPDGAAVRAGWSVVIGVSSFLKGRMH